jgi:hypothetical protein
VHWPAAVAPRGSFVLAVRHDARGSRDLLI